jgi:hypothetical protein
LEERVGLAPDTYFRAAMRPRVPRRRHHRAAANAAGSTGEPRVQSVAGFNFVMWLMSSSSVAQPMKYRHTIS